MSTTGNMDVTDATVPVDLAELNRSIVAEVKRMSRGEPLTRLEQFTLAAMQGAIANPKTGGFFFTIGEDAVRFARATLAALDKEQGK